MYEEVTAYRTSDGTLFENPLDAAEHENEGKFSKEMGDFWDRYGYSGMTREDAEDICISNCSELYRILKEYHSMR